MQVWECVWFIRCTESDDDYWSLVEHFRGQPRGEDHCRGGETPWYDVVAGLLSRDWVNRKVVQGSDQVSFHTPRALDLLNTLVDKGIFR